MGTGAHIIVVGAGPGGLTCAMILARRGCRVTVLEGRETVGGRNAAIHLGPYTFDTGPTFLMLKPVLDQVFEEAGTPARDVLEFTPLDPLYRLQFDDRALEVTSDHDRMRANIEACFPGRGDRFGAFFAREGKRFRRLLPCLQMPYDRVSALWSRRMLKALPHLALGRSLFSVMRGVFGDEQLALAFTFQSKYLGMSPWACPGLFAMIPYVEHAFGLSHTTGGLNRISEAMADVARRNGADVQCGRPVRRILVDRRTVQGVQTADGERITADAVVINADFGHAMSHLFEPGALRKYTPERLARMRLSCSTFMMYLGLDMRVDLPHHTIVFARDYRGNVEGIFAGRRPGADISFYVQNASVTDPTLAPAGHAALYVLVPVPNTRSGIDWREYAPGFREMVLDALARRAGLAAIRDHIRQEKVTTPDDWRDARQVYEGATFNLAHNVRQMTYFRPRNRFEELDRCYLVGGGTHPGSGLPTIYESGRISANLICTRLRLPFVSPNTRL